LLNQQKEQLADSLRQTQDSIPGKIKEAKQPLEDKISQLNGEYANAQHDIADKAKQIEEISRNLAQSQKDTNDKKKPDSPTAARDRQGQ